MEYRICSICGKKFTKGYYSNTLDKYYCSDNCLHKDYSEQEWNDECDENPESYWTTWE